MPRSMTAFARLEKRADWGSLSWELRSVNHRYLEIAPRLPEDLRHLEPRVRDCVSERLSRGKVDCVLKLQLAPGAALTAPRLNREFTDNLRTVYRELEELWGESARPDLIQLLRWPGVIEETEADLTPVAEAAMDTLNSALDELVSHREREGSKLAELILQRCDGIEQMTDRLSKDLPAIHASLHERTLNRISELGVDVDPGRLEQEVVLLAQKLDVAEEVDRLRAHARETRRTLDTKGPVGRRLDFLMQELNREANTLAAKSADLDTNRASVDLKVLIEQMREQVQNLE